MKCVWCGGKIVLALIPKKKWWHLDVDGCKWTYCDDAITMTFNKIGREAKPNYIEKYYEKINKAGN